MNYRICLLIVASGMALPVMAEPQCSAQTTRGTWLYTCEGELPVGVPARILGTCETSRSGFFDCTGKANAGGTVLTQGLRGQSQTAPDCTGNISYTQSFNGNVLPGTLDIYYVVSENGDRIDGLPINSGGVLSCSLKRTSR